MGIKFSWEEYAHFDVLKVEIVKNPKFADKDGNIPTRFEFKIYHVNNGAEQLFTTPKTLCKQIVTELQRGFTVFEIVPRGDLAIYDRRAIRLRQGPTNSRDYTDVKTGVTGRIWKDFNLAYNFRTNWTEKITGLVT